MIFFSSDKILNDDRTLDLALCTACGESPEIRGEVILCDCGNRIQMMEFSETVAAWNRANSDVEEIIEQNRRTI